jgi:hypothetical protein
LRTGGVRFSQRSVAGGFEYDRRTTKDGSVIARVREVSWGGGCGYEGV